MNMNKVEMNDNMLNEVVGGYIGHHRKQLSRTGKIHNNCGGIIDNPWFGNAVCQKCGESHPFLFQFDYHDPDKS